MTGRMKTFAASLLPLTLLAASPARAAISSVVNNNSLNGVVYTIETGALTGGALAYVDRDHEWENLPASLIGADYIKTANGDKRASGLTVEVTVDRLADLYLFIDDRVNPFVATEHGWVVTLGFVDTGIDIGMDEGGDGVVNRSFSVWELEGVAPGSTVVLSDLDTGRESNFYGVAAVPEPTSLALLGLGGLLVARRH